MGRRNRSKRNHWDDDGDDEYGIDRAEKKWLNRQTSAKKRQRASDEDVDDGAPLQSKSVNVSKNNDDRGESEIRKIPNTNMDAKQKGPTKPTTSSPAASTSPSSEQDTINKRKLKKQRQKEKRKQKKAEADSKSANVSKHHDDRGESESKKIPNANQDAKQKSPTKPTTSSPAASKSPSSEQDKIDRRKLKKQRQKEERKQKRAEAASAAKEAKQKRLESEQAIRTKQKQEKEKKAKLKPQSSTQQFKTLAKGVKYQDLTLGKGPQVLDRKKVRVSYTLRAKSHTTGKIIDASANFGFRVGKGETIKGFDIGLEGMKVGGVRRLVIPPGAGYGNHKDVGAGRGADLYFQIELLHVAP